MAKRTGLQVKRPSAVLAAAAEAKESPETKQGIRTAGISLPVSTWELLADVALSRKKKRERGRASLSAILLELVERHRDELEAELNP